MVGLLDLALAKEGSSNEGLVDAPKHKRKRRKNKNNKGVSCEVGEFVPRLLWLCSIHWYLWGKY
jgi:hypothetical protein